MGVNAKRRIVAGAVAGLAVAGGGAAVAATQLGSPKQEDEAIVADAAKQLGIQPQQLSAALTKALEDRVDAAVADGRLTRDEGDAIKQRIESGELPFFLPSPGGPFGPPPGGPFGQHLDAAASYLGLSEVQLRSQLEAGKTLAQIASDRDKPVDGLVQALVDQMKQKLDSAVGTGKLTKSQEESFLAGLKDRVTALVNGRIPPILTHRFGPRPRPPALGPGF